MQVLKVVAEGVTTSFRYPQFMQQIHPSYPMPPPATIYGHIASALGEWFDPSGVKFAYHFSYAGKVKDLEHIIVLTPSSGDFIYKQIKMPKVLSGNVNPFIREMYFKPRLVLYLNRPEWEAAFHRPRYPVILGRSQDLFTYTKISVVELRKEDQAYFEHTLLPYSTTRYTHRGFAVLMPRFLDYSRNRKPDFAQYFIVEEKIQSKDFLWFTEHAKETYWIDPLSELVDGAHLGLHFLNFVGEDDEA